MELGGGSAYGGKWRPNPNKPHEIILQGTANTIQRHFIPGKNGGYWVQVKYGSDGWAVKIRHETIHDPNQDHTNPHDHIIEYNPHNHSPIYVKSQINYPPEQHPDGAPEFKRWIDWSDSIMQFSYDAEELRYKTLSEFKYSLRQGGEIVIEWNGNCYGIFYNGEKFYVTTNNYETTYYDSPDELLEYCIDRERLRDIVTQVTVVDRAL